MPTPATRTPVRIARGTYANLLASIADLSEGEICYATDEDTLYIKNGGSLVASGKRLKGDLRFGDSDNSNWVALQAPATVSTNVTWTLPSADGTNGQVLGTNGSGTLSWITASGGASVTTSDTAPVSPSDGDLWYRSTDGRLYVYYDDGTTSQWVDAAPQGGGAGGASVTTSDTAPSSPNDGDLWYDSVGGRTYVYYQDPNGSQWVDASPQGGGGSGTSITTGNTTAEVIDTGSDGRFVVTTEGTEALRVDSSRRLLVGTNTSLSLDGFGSNLQLEATTFAASQSIVRHGGPAAIRLGRSGGNAIGSTTVVANGNELGALRFIGADGSDFDSIAGQITCEVDGTPGANDMPGRLVFATTADGAASPTERVRIDSSGRVNIGNNQGSMDSGADDLVLGTGSGNNGMTIYSGLTGIGAINFANGNSGTNRYQGILFYDHNAQELCAATDNGSARWRTGSTGFYPNADNNIPLGKSGARWSAVWAANGTIQTSDQREKTEITDSALGINFVKTLRPVSYKWIEGGKVQVDGERDTYEPVPGTRTHWGFIAQEVKQAVDAAGVDFGGWVLTDKDDPNSQQALRYDQFIAPLTKALQEALQKIETLEAQNASLEARLTALEGGN